MTDMPHVELPSETPIILETDMGFSEAYGDPGSDRSYEASCNRIRYCYCDCDRCSCLLDFR